MSFEELQYFFDLIENLVNSRVKLPSNVAVELEFMREIAIRFYSNALLDKCLSDPRPPSFIEMRRELDEALDGKKSLEPLKELRSIMMRRSVLFPK